MRARCLVAFLSLLAVPALAQQFTATIRGAVTDQTGAAIGGAKVTVRGEGTGVTRTTNTNSSGLYSFPELPVGSYQVQVDLTGFKSAVIKGIVLNVADVRAVDAQLTTGGVEEQVTVEAAAVAVKTIGGDVSGVVTGEQVRELPLNGRNFLQLGTLMPGVSQGDSFNTKDRGLMSGIDLAVSGSGVIGNMWTVDGANNNDVGSNHTILVFPSVDAIEEMKVHRNSYGAEFGGASGAQVNIVTRGGTNEFHGSVYYFGRNDALSSKNYFLEQAGQDKAKLKFHDFGATFGGPIIKDKVHFFVSQEWSREKRGIVRTAFVPTAAERRGDFSGPGIDGCTPPTPIDPLTGAPFPGNQIPQDRLSPGGLLLLQLYPLPNTTPGAGSCNNWVDSVNTPINWRQDNVRLDWAVSDRTHVMLRYTQDSWTNKSPSAVETLWGDDPFPAVDSNWEQPGRSLTAQLTKNIGSTAVNTLTFAYSANVITVTRGGLTPDLNGRINAAIPGIFPDSIKEYGSERGHPIFGGSQGYDGLQNMAPFKNNQNLFVLKDDYSAVFGKHFFKVGAVASYNQKNEDVFDQGSAESSQIGDSVGLGGTGVATGNILADLLLRDMAFSFTENSAERSIKQRWRDVEAYVADSWKIHPRVTLDLGVRFSRFESPYDVDDTITSFDPAAFDPALGSDACNGLLVPPGSTACADAGLRGGRPGPTRGLAKTNNYFAPRLGIAWDVSGDGKTAVRAGVGEFFDREPLQGGLNLGFNSPFNRTQTGSRTLDSNAPPCPECFSASNGIPVAGIDTTGKMGYNWQWNLTFEREIVRNTTLEVSYVGSKGYRLLHAFDPNQVPAGDHNGNGIPDRLEYVQAGEDTEAKAALRPYGVFGDNNINLQGHGGSSSYHSLQTQLISRFGRGSQFQASYTLSRTIGDVPLNDGPGSLTAGNSVSLLENPGLDRGLTRTHRKHIFNASLVLALPELEGQPGFVKHVFGGWEIGTIAQAASGTPVTVYIGDVPGIVGGPSGTGFSDNQRPNRVPGQPCRATGGPAEQWLNPGAFTLTGFQLGTFGDAGRGICEGPNLVQVDLALYKNIKLSDRVKAQLRFEVFNVFNRRNFVDVNTTLNPTSVTFDTGDPATATKITGFTLPASFGQAQATRDPRQAQFGIKLVF